MKTLPLLALVLFSVALPALAEESADPLPESNIPKAEFNPAQSPDTSEKPSSIELDGHWFRSAGEYVASRLTRMGVPTEPTATLSTDAKRFDFTLGKRIALFTFGERQPTNTWVAGIDGGMLASLTRYNSNDHLLFATNTFDGFFGAYIARAINGWIFSLHTAHLSAHQVDNSPQIAAVFSYSHFWNELTVAKTFPAPDRPSDWELHVQGTIGANNSSAPATDGPRLAFGITASQALKSGSNLGLVASADYKKTGVYNQPATYAYFLGFGTINRPNSKIRPFRTGVAYFKGSDYRNQFYKQNQDWATFQISTEF